MLLGGDAQKNRQLAKLYPLLVLASIPSYYVTPSELSSLMSKPSHLDGLYNFDGRLDGYV
jgi:hypothetical protein